ncbi:hypothetical protein Tsubulata_001818 [Turnera subulata]|uniref:C2H2-type domain-containing protein n=1 Tax=Turnera subulata TaxID=218843 RepID=A0A9Q0G2R3_9ROSI|nr:hypothetical protein Tsubulata_001818 [Turnera subulata]
METDQSSSEETLEQVSKLARSEEQVIFAGQSRSYECTFCKRGFSNAQALGGHMNIHRKDKLKLKKHPNESTPQPSSMEAKCSGGRVNSSPEKWSTWVPADKEMISPDEATIQQLPLFVDQQKETNIEVHGSRAGIGLLADNSAEELDLELRLGPDQPLQDSSPQTTGTRKFF